MTDTAIRLLPLTVRSFAAKLAIEILRKCNLAVAPLLLSAVMGAAAANAQSPWRDGNRSAALAIRAGQFAEGEQAALAGLSNCPAAGVEEPLCASIFLQNAGDAEVGLGKKNDAEVNFRRSLEVRRKGLPDGHPLIADSELRLGVFLQRENRPAEAEPLFANAATIMRGVGPRGADTLLTILGWWESALVSIGRVMDAIPLSSEAHALAVRMNGANSEQALFAASNRVSVLRQADMPGASLDVALSILDQPKFETAAPRWQLWFAGRAAQAAHLAGRFDPAKTMAMAALPLAEAPGADEADAVNLLVGLSRLAGDVGDTKAALSYADRALRLSRGAVDRTVAATVAAQANFALGDPSAAAAQLESAIAAATAADPVAQGNLRAYLASAYVQLGDPDRAAAEEERAIVLLEGRHGAEASLIAAYRNLVTIRLDLHDISGALAAAKSAVAVPGDTAAIARERPGALAVAALAAANAFREPQGSIWARQAEAMLDAMQPDDARAAALLTLAQFYEATTRTSSDAVRATAYADRARKAYWALGNHNGGFAAATRMLGRGLIWQLRAPEGEALCQEALAHYRRLPGAHAIELAQTKSCIGEAQYQLGRVSEAEQSLSDALTSLRSAQQGGDANEAAEIGGMLGLTLRDQGRFGEARTLLTTARQEALTAGIGRGVPYAGLLSNLGSVLRRIGDFDAARAVDAEALALLEAMKSDAGDNGLIRAVLLRNEALIAEATGNQGEALPLFEEAAQLRHDRLPEASWLVAESDADLAQEYAHVGRIEQAATQQDATVSAYRAIGPIATLRLKLALVTRADLALKAGDLLAAEHSLRDALAASEQVDGSASPNLADLRLALAELLDREGRHGEADAMRADAVSALATAQGDNSTTVIAARLAMLPALRAAGRGRDAAAAVEACEAALQAQAAGDPLLRRQCLAANAANQVAAGNYKVAREVAAQLVATAETVDGGTPALLASLLLLARAEAGLGNPAQVTAIFDRVNSLPGSGPFAEAQRAEMLTLSGQLLVVAGDRVRAEASFRDALSAARIGSSNQYLVVTATDGLGQLLIGTGRARDAVSLWRNALAGRVNSAPLRAAALRGLARAALAVAASTDAAKAFDEAASLDRVGSGAASTEYVADLLGAAQARAQIGDWSGAADRLDQLAGDASPAVVIARLDCLTSLAVMAGDVGAALAHSQAALRVAEDQYGPNSVVTGLLGISLAQARLQAGDRAGAADILTQIEPVLKSNALGGRGAAALANARAMLLAEEGSFNAADTALAEVEQSIEATEGEGSLAAAIAHANRGIIAMRAGDLDRADQLLAEAMSRAVAVSESRNPVWARIALIAAEVADRRGEHSRSISLRREATPLLPDASNHPTLQRWL